jgi:hypothetical protein
LRDQPSVVSLKFDKAEEASQVWTALFMKRSGPLSHLRLYWAWNSGGNWEASASPRWQYRGQPYLYKLYVSRDNSRQPNLAPQADPAAEFLRGLIPVMRPVLFPAGAAEVRVADALGTH